MIKDAWYIKFENESYFVCLQIGIEGVTVGTCSKKEYPVFIAEEHMALQISNALCSLGFSNDLYNFFTDQSWGDIDIIDLVKREPLYPEDLEFYGKGNIVF